MRKSDAVIAIVDDDPWARDGLEDLIRSAGWRAEAFESAQEFLARALCALGGFAPVKSEKKHSNRC